MINQVRHGDVFLIRVDAPPKGAKLRKHTGPTTLAFGEVTGHSHSIAEEYGVSVIDGVRGLPDYIGVPPQGAILTHEEHGDVTLPEGIFQVVIQREYEPEIGQRQVVD